MKIKLRWLAAILSITAVCLIPVGMATLQGCTAPQQRIAFNTIGSLQTGATAAVDGYFALVIRGQVPTNGVATVSADYNKFQGGVLVALDLVQNNTNALAPSSLIQLSTDLISEIKQFTGGK